MIFHLLLSAVDSAIFHEALNIFFLYEMREVAAGVLGVYVCGTHTCFADCVASTGPLALWRAVYDNDKSLRA